ncbi:hypothetical protein Poly51_26230 [Rubripirellula tenax]|uniref:Mce/MlaD domain-containing protein n=1 Tax=Rubripirellula tenax TaxID=2528015 RepID=A0A5C6F960_9BACT|nr:hypothetical protein [Rubripirellula tenax]TWU56706.1 hypothetical protein Poly51_26230 [Rubripirellula tenax]
MNEPYRLRYTNQIVGAFLLVLLLLLILLALMLLRASDYFAEKKTYWFEIAQDQVQDMHPGVEVVILGRRAGAVEAIEYIADSDRIRVNVSIDPEMSNLVFDNSFIVPSRKYGVGTPVLNIRRGRTAPQSAVPLPTGSKIEAFQSEDDRIERMAREVESVSESVRMIEERLKPTLATIESAGKNFDQSMSETIRPTFEETRTASASFLKTNEQLRPETSQTLSVIRQATIDLQSQVGALTTKIEAMVDHDMRITLADVRESTDAISAAAKSAEATSTEVNESVADTLVKLQQAAEQVRLLALETRDVVRIVRREADDLPGTTERVNDTVSETQDLVGEIRGHWLLRRSGSRPTSSQQVSPTMVGGGSVR